MKYFSSLLFANMRKYKETVLFFDYSQNYENIHISCLKILYININKKMLWMCFFTLRYCTEKNEDITFHSK